MPNIGCRYSAVALRAPGIQLNYTMQWNAVVEDFIVHEYTYVSPKLDPYF